MLSRRIASRLRDMETPFYLYDTELLRQTLESVVNESKRYNYKVHYAIKANPAPEILEVLVALCPYCMVVWFAMLPIFWFLLVRNGGVKASRQRGASRRLRVG